MHPTFRMSVLVTSPLALILLVTLVIPAGTFFVFSFLTFNLRKVQMHFTLDNYVIALTDPLYRKLAWNTLLIATPTTLLAVVGGYLVAYYLAFNAARSRNPLLALVVLSMMASYLVRIYAWRTILGEQGIFNSALAYIGFTDGPIELLLFSRMAVTVAQVNIFLPFTTLLLYSSLLSITRDLRESACDLGAAPGEVIRRIVIPLSGTALLSATMFTFFVSAGDFITPVFLGGRNSATFGTAIADELRLTSNYALGSALSFIMLFGFAVSYLLVKYPMKLVGFLPRRGIEG
jgi:spermidine/putrescine transport system permease protein